MNLLQILNPNYNPGLSSTKDRYAAAQEKILQYLLLASVVLGAAAFAVIIPPAVQARTWDTVFLGSLLLAGLTGLPFLRSKPYAVRAGGFLAVLFLLSIQFLLKSGINPLSLVLFFMLVFLSGLFFGIELAAVVFGLWTAAGITTMLTPGQGWDLLANAMPAQRGSPGWLVSMTALGAISAVAILVMIAVNRELRKSGERENQLEQDLDKERTAVETQLEERTLYFQRRLIEARAAAEISRSVSSILDPNELLQQVVDLILERFKLYYVGIFVIDQENKYAVLKAGTGEAGKRMLADGHRLQVGGTSMIGWATRSKEPRIAHDIGQEAVRFNNPNLPLTRSELALPIVVRSDALGAMTVQSTQANAFDEDDILILHGIADSIGVALENARLYQKSQEALDEVRAINAAFVQKSWSDTIATRRELQYTFENTPAEISPTAAAHNFPLLLRDQVIGEIILETGEAELSPEDAALVETITLQTAAALENARLVEESQRNAFKENKLNEMSRQFTQAESIEDILKIAVTELGGLPYATEVSIHLVPPELTPAVPYRAEER